MNERKRAAIGIALALALCAGCGEKTDYEKCIRQEREKHEKEIARLRAAHAAEIEGYREKLRLIESEMDSMGGKAALATTSQGAVAAGGGRAGTAGEAADTEATEGPPGEKAGTAENGVESAAREEMDYVLEWFAYSRAAMVEPGVREQFKKDFNEYISGLREEGADEPATGKKERMLDSLRERIAGASDQEEREVLEQRAAKIENAAEEDLQGVLDYYQELDDIRGLNDLMEKYDISGQELSESGIDPPPRVRWGPDPRETAYNLANFVDRYEPLTDASERARYREEFDTFIEGLTAKLTDEELFVRRDEMLADMEQRARTASEREKRWMERRMRMIENADADSMRRSVQMEKMRDIGRLVEKYSIPARELSQSGVWFPRSRRRGD